MHLKSIHMEGFKSYGKRVEIDGFDTKFNAITGLNGTGKSNILDAICFVLGISNLTHVRVANLQELIFKNGQTGVNSATVTLLFDNSDRESSPPSYEDFKEIAITRQIVIGGKNKYWINSCIVPNKKVQDLFCSVQMNVNNPHFIIMQGKVTKVLNMKAHEILAMLEEAAGTQMYETKKQQALKLLAKKNTTFEELTAIINEEINPRLEKLKRERQSYLDYINLERELVKMKKLYEGFVFYASQRVTKENLVKLKASEEEVQKIQNGIDLSLEEIVKIVEELDQMTKNLDDSSAGELMALEAQVKEKEKSNSKASATIKAGKDSIKNDQKKLKTMKGHQADDLKSLETKQNLLNKVNDFFATLKQNDERDKAAYELAQKKYEAVCSGMEFNESGEAQSLQEQLIAMKEEAAAKKIEIQTSTSKLSHLEKEVRAKQAQIGFAGADYNTAQSNYVRTRGEVIKLEEQMAKLNYSEDDVGQLRQYYSQLVNDMQQHKAKVNNFETSRPFTKFNYRDPAPNFDRSQVDGVVCKLITPTENKYCTALETAAGGKLYNVVCQNEQVSKLILKNGQLQQRTTMLPLNKIQGSQIPQNVVQRAQQLVGKENVIPALELIQFDRKLQPAMEYIFGQAFVCTDLNVAKKVTFHPQIKRKCVTLDGDVTDPSGTMSGGARQKSAPVLLQISDVVKSEGVIRKLEAEVRKLQPELTMKQRAEEQYQQLQQRLDIKMTELQQLEKSLQQTSHHRNVQEVDEMQQQIEALKQNLDEAKEREKVALEKGKEIEGNLKNADQHKKKMLQTAEDEMNRAKKQAEASKEEWQQREAEYEILQVEIKELTASLEQQEKEVAAVENEIESVTREIQQLEGEFEEHEKELGELQTKLKTERAAIANKNRSIAKKNEQKEKIEAKITEHKLEIQRLEHNVAKHMEAHKNSVAIETQLQKKAEKLDALVMKEAANLTDKEGNALQRRITSGETDKTKLGRNINVNAQKMFENEEKQHKDLVKHKTQVEMDKIKITKMLKELDEKKEQAVTLAYNRVKKDFGSIFSTLLPGANATLAPPTNKTIADGLEIRVSLGGIWKENLAELSGGQRSLAALSLIFAMLRFKPAPLYILDEVDAALDLSHTANIGEMLKNHFKQSQFIVVSLKDGMFSNANVLFKTQLVDGVSAVKRTVNKT